MKSKTTIKASPKSVVYLIGAGATQAEADHRGGKKIDLLMKGLSPLILKKANADRLLGLRDEEPDIEKLISLLESTGMADYRKAATNLREAYYETILANLCEAKILSNPELAIGLMEMHRNKTFKGHEILSGIISLNHDNLFQIASRKVFGYINLGFTFDDSYFKRGLTTIVPRIIHLHGAFNWINSTRTRVVELDPSNKYNPDMLWIPPTILKEAKDYPYNKLTGLAYELLLRCDILRIIGCSLSQNDWNIISLIFNAQYKQYVRDKKSFHIQLIMPPEAGDKIVSELSYLKNIVPIGFLTDGKFADYKKAVKERSSGMGNSLEYWLKTKVKFHIRNSEFDTKKMGATLKSIIGA